MRVLKSVLAATIATAWLLQAGTSAAQTVLPRKATLGIAMGGAPAGEEAHVSQVVQGQTAASLGVQTGDVIVAIDGQPMTSSADVVTRARTLIADQPIALTVQRAGKKRTLRGTTIGRPRERYDGATVTYGSIDFRGGKVADLFVAPANVEKPPVVFLIQGFSCVSVESPDPDETNRQLAATFVRAGIAFYRVEKPGMGDSSGGVRCQDIDYATETDAFRTAYRHLTDTLGVERERIFILGHSLGGLQAPMLAAERAPRGVAVYGTVLRNWADYHHHLMLVQPFAAFGADPVEAANASEAYREVFRRFYIERQSPQEIAAAKPEYAPLAQQALAWSGGAVAMGRDYHYLQDLAGLPLVAAWRDTRARVLSIFGSSDVAAVDSQDHRRIADVVNHYRPGTAEFREIPDTDHPMRRVGDLAEVRRRAAAGETKPGPFSAPVAEALVAWVRESMAKPPVG